MYLYTKAEARFNLNAILKMKALLILINCMVAVSLFLSVMTYDIAIAFITASYAYFSCLLVKRNYRKVYRIIYSLTMYIK